MLHLEIEKKIFLKELMIFYKYSAKDNRVKLFNKVEKKIHSPLSNIPDILFLDI